MKDVPGRSRAITQREIRIARQLDLAESEALELLRHPGAKPVSVRCSSSDSRQSRRSLGIPNGSSPPA
ncbi:hypothetical protein, partial [Klebsiella pneumoniae]|uniref:hypothetical protein n=1 Tax=Klebsiella pneumoniae TaxID=573 RepID=UPI003012D1A2